MTNSIWALIPPLITIAMVLLTKRVLLSLGVGIIATAFFTVSFHFTDAMRLIWEAFKGVFVEDGGVNTWNVYILLFVLLLGVLTSFVSMMGGTRAFGEWMIKRVKTRAGAQLMTMVLGIIIFIDDYFNSLTVGPISRPVTDKHNVSRAKLAYIVDSTAAPVSVIAPISSWGAYIIGLIGSVLVAENVTGYGPFEAFIQMIPMNFYVWAALGMVFVMAIRQSDFGPMKKHELRALQTGKVASETQTKESSNIEDLPTSDIGKSSDLFLPIGILFIATIVMIYWDGLKTVQADADLSNTLINIFGEADVSLALLVGGIAGIIGTWLLFLRHLVAKKVTVKDFGKGIITGIKSMLSAFAILIFAWAISFLIGELQTGEYLAGLVNASNISLTLLPFIVFVMAGFIAFATGTSWGAFAILLPIAGQIAGATDIDLLLPVLAAVLAGAVFGDHCSPISDTTILSATGADCKLYDHFSTQLPYALTAAGIASVGYLVLGFTGNVWYGLLAVLIGLLILAWVLKNKPTQMHEQKEHAIK